MGISNSFLISLSKGNNNRYLTMTNQDGQTRIMCFEHSKDANRCKQYVEHFKTAYGKCPSLDLSASNHKIDFKSEKFYEYNSEVSIKEVDSDTFDYFSTQKKANFLVCKSFTTSFEKNKHIINFTGQEILSDSCDTFSNISFLNSIYEND
tara:strand:- start:5966 stop:6415 length:450 start_codon:yes stop_codon:yes gene_type:complete